MPATSQAWLHGVLGRKSMFDGQCPLPLISYPLVCIYPCLQPHLTADASSILTDDLRAWSFTLTTLHTVSDQTKHCHKFHPDICVSRARLQGEPTQLPGPESCHAKGRIQRNIKRIFSGIIHIKFHQEKLR
jgi:hypothetical protein